MDASQTVARAKFNERGIHGNLHQGEAPPQHPIAVGAEGRVRGQARHAAPSHHQSQLSQIRNFDDEILFSLWGDHLHPHEYAGWTYRRVLDGKSIKRQTSHGRMQPSQNARWTEQTRRRAHRLHFGYWIAGSAVLLPGGARWRTREHRQALSQCDDTTGDEKCRQMVPQYFEMGEPRDAIEKALWISRRSNVQRSSSQRAKFAVLG
mmetsp:Transcript_21775/g.47386  ORF Transcript_21775/g.47386 Transcript_21775/m.47386 type:complete len:206 (-) Transcript_21775:555-1172(-)